jgi:uncharacterized PurR-regulated membrane protein YhhQ (DUF165 family)
VIYWNVRAANAALIAGYLTAIVLANLSIERWGPRAAIWNAAILIGADLVVRDRLHDAWRSHLKRNMAALIVAGSVLSYLVNNDAGRIALASCVAFGAAATVDALVYHLRRNASWSDRANESNLAGAAADSILFPLIAFGTPLSATFVLTLWSAKVAGGYAWSLLLRPRSSYRCDIPGCNIDHVHPRR